MTQMAGKEKVVKISSQATSIPADRVPDMGKRNTMNLLLLGAIALPTATMLYPYTYFFVPPGYVLLSAPAMAAWIMEGLAYSI